MNHDHFQSQVKNIYKTVRELEAMFPGRPFTPDGHMVGSNEGYDAKTKDGRKVEIKATQSKSVAFRS